jgi:hypothetical protein
MKKVLLFFVFVCISVIAKTQGNLQFNQVLTFEPGDSYTVPNGKVLKIESVNMNSTTLCLPKTGETDNTKSWAPKTICKSGLYNGINYLSIGNQVFNSPSFDGRSSGTQFSDGSCNYYNETCKIIDFGAIIFNCPIWLESGKTVYINSAVSSILISAIEFNIIP